MSFLWFLRHGQAGPRDHYDRLSDLGRRQAAELGACLVREVPSPAAFYCGSLRRQRETAAGVLAAYRAAGLACPEPAIDPRWNEFDLDEVFAGVAPLLAAADPAFAAEWREQRREAESPESAVHRTWTAADAAVIRAWIEDRFPEFEGESWPGFNRRVLSTRAHLLAHGPQDQVLIATSGTPVAIWIAQALEIPTRHVMRLAGASRNCNYSVLRLAPESLELLSFNVAAHISTRTQR